MKKGRRYDTSGIAEAEFEPGSGRRVLKNLPGIKRKREMDQVEARELLRAHEEIVALYDRDHQFNAGDICKMHQDLARPDISLGGAIPEGQPYSRQFYFRRGKSDTQADERF